MTFTVENLDSGKIGTYDDEISTNALTEAFGLSNVRLVGILDELGIQRREVKKYPNSLYAMRLIPESSIPALVGYLKELADPKTNQPYYAYLQGINPENFHVIRRPTERGPHTSAKAHGGSAYRLTRRPNLR